LPDRRADDAGGRALLAGPSEAALRRSLRCEKSLGKSFEEKLDGTKARA
jgi:hypothetical protein